MKKYIICISLLISLLASNALCNEHGEGGGGGKKKKGAKEGEEAPKMAISEADLFIATKNYVHKWIDFQPLTGQNLLGETTTITHEKGKTEVLFFTASWCIPCQEQMKKIMTLEQIYKPLHTKFIYVFAHDLFADSQAFAKEYKVPIEEGIVANHDILKAYHNPELPSVYVSDRDGWILERFLKFDETKDKKLDRLLYYLNSF